MNKSEPLYKIRLAQPEDQNTIQSLLLSYKLPLDGLGDAKLWVLQSSKGVVLGVAGLEIYGTQGLLRSVAVSKEFQRRGYGTLLTKHIIAEAKKSEIVSLFLLTTTAPAFFKKLGFKEESRQNVSGGITESVEFKSACPKTAVLMFLKLI